MYNKGFADYAVNFIRALKLGDDFYGQPFELMDWQEEAVREFYGTLRDEQYRQYQYLYLEIPKKNGKTQLAAALGLFHTFADEAKDGEVYICAADRSNASIAFNAALSMLNQCPALLKRAKIRESTKEIIDKKTNTKMKVMSSDAYSKHGYKPTCVVFDELHAQPHRDLWDVMTFGSGTARKQPVYIVLTTAGDDPDRNSIGWEIHERARKIIEYRKGKKEGNYDNPLWLPYIWGLGGDPEECEKVDIYDERVWAACNPSLGKTIPIELLRIEAAEARESEAAEKLFRWLRLNQWISVKSTGWLPLSLYDKTEKEIDHALLKGKRCYAGLDLSSTTDLTALCLLFPPQEGLEKWHAIFRAWIPEEKMRERSRRDHVPFDVWVKNGYVLTVPGDCMDFDFVEAEILRAAEEYKLVMLGTDPYLSRMLSQHMIKKEIDTIEIPQTMAGMSPAMKELERLLRTDEMTHEKNPCGRWCFGNVRTAVDGNENIKPMKNRSIDRIDIAVGWINAMATAMLDVKVDINAKILAENWSL